MKDTTQKNYRVLLVDDDDELRTALTKLLQRNGYTVIAKPDAATALTYLSTGEPPPDLVVTDVLMPGLKGTQLLTILKQDFPELPVIVITAFGDWCELGEAMHNGAFQYLCKPLELDEFLGAVHRALTGATPAWRSSPVWDGW
ncbi:MAG: DNA-binding transcriptional regulator NtrC [Verrucomicrobiae bacterium]|nr:DNA-binding transcriptional regulator NtrC [Verrucomicrobiae bacterium]